MKSAQLYVRCSFSFRLFSAGYCVLFCMIKKGSNKIISRNKKILGGTPVFKGTRVPVKAIWDYLKAGDTVEDFLEDFPSVEREQAIALIERAPKRVVSSK